IVDLERYGIDEPTLKKMLAEWRGGLSKTAIERRYLGKATHHGKLFTKLVRDHLGVETSVRHPLAIEVDRLRALLAVHGIDPDGR
ncbi:unnamed protein product, partial [Phaeothamnion confervicola]